MSDHPEIWLEPKCAGNNHPEGRQWCQDAVFETCSECGEKPTRYIRADIVEAERHRHAEVMEEVRKEGRRQGLEEAAAWHEGEAEKFGELYHANKHNHVLSDKLAGYVIKHQAYASSIRALLSRLEER